MNFVAGWMDGAVSPEWETNWAFIWGCWKLQFAVLCSTVLLWYLQRLCFALEQEMKLKGLHPEENTGTASRRTLLPSSLSASRGLESLVVLTGTRKMSKVVYGKFCTVYKVLVLPISQTERQDVLSERWPQDDRHIPSLSGDVIKPPLHQAPPALHLHEAS